MGYRNMLCTTQMIGLETDQQGHRYRHPCPDPCIIFGGLQNIPLPDRQMVIAAPVNASNLDTHHPPEGAQFYGMPQYHCIQRHPHNVPDVDLGIAAASNLYVPYMNPSADIPLDHADDFPSSRNYGVISGPIDEYGMNWPFMGDARGSYKSKIAEGNPGYIQPFNVLASSTFSIAPCNSWHPDGVAPVAAASVTQNSYGGNGASAIGEAGLHRSVRNRSSVGGHLVLAHHPNHLSQGTHIGQPFVPAPSLWVDQQLSNSNSTNASALAWTRGPPIPFMHGSNVNGVFSENSGLVPQRYHEMPNNRSRLPFPPPLSAHLQHISFHHLSPPFQGTNSQNINVLPQAPLAPYGIPASYTLQSTSSLEDGFDIRLRHATVQPTGIRMYRPHHEGAVPETALRHHNLPYLRVLPTDGVALLEFPDHHEVENYIDHHRDMRLDIEDMSYEELLTLGEWIGNVSTGLSEENIRSQLKTKKYLSSPASISLEESACMDQEPDSCIICQDDYKSGESIATLDCGHEYHADCLKKWLRLKNICPTCKSEALTSIKKDGNE